ncbi:hypothetical protein [Xanthobacter sediminis]
MSNLAREFREWVGKIGQATQGSLKARDGSGNWLDVNSTNISAEAARFQQHDTAADEWVKNCSPHPEVAAIEAAPK